jgi:hypothetical protein
MAAAESDTLPAFASGRVPASWSAPPRCSPSSQGKPTPQAQPTWVAWPTPTCYLCYSTPPLLLLVSEAAPRRSLGAPLRRATPALPHGAVISPFPKRAEFELARRRWSPALSQISLASARHVVPEEWEVLAAAEETGAGMACYSQLWRRWAPPSQARCIAGVAALLAVTDGRNPEAAQSSRTGDAPASAVSRRERPGDEDRRG